MSAARKIEYVPLDDLTADPRNPKNHDVETIDASVGRFGIVDLIVVDGRTGYIVSGHGRTKTLQAMRDRGESAPEGVKVSKDGTWLVPVSSGWASRSDAEAAAALIAMNRTTELGGWVDDALLDLLEDLNVDDAGLDGIGFDTQDIDDLHKLLSSHSDDGLDDLDDLADEETDDEDEMGPSGQSFKTLDVLVGEPNHDTPHGAVYRLGGRHYLVIAKLGTEHDLWAHLLPGRVFAPYPDVYLPLGESPKETEFVFVQPNKYLAGHLLDKWASVHGEDTIERVQA